MLTLFLGWLFGVVIVSLTSIKKTIIQIKKVLIHFYRLFVLAHFPSGSINTDGFFYVKNAKKVR